MTLLLRLLTPLDVSKQTSEAELVPEHLFSQPHPEVQVLLPLLWDPVLLSHL